MSFWTNDRDAKLRQHADEGLSAKESADIFGCTRNSVIGRRWRLKIASSAPNGGAAHKRAKKTSKPSKPKPATIPAPEVVAMPQPAPVPIHDLFPPMPKIDAPTGAGAAIMALRPSSCRWPIGNPATDDFHFCMAPHGAGVSYCREHERASWGKGTVSEQRAIKGALKVASA